MQHYKTSYVVYVIKFASCFSFLVYRAVHGKPPSRVCAHEVVSPLQVHAFKCGPQFVEASFLST